MKQTILKKIHILCGSGALVLVIASMAAGSLSGQYASNHRLDAYSAHTAPVNWDESASEATVATEHSETDQDEKKDRKSKSDIKESPKVAGTLDPPAPLQPEAKPTPPSSRAAPDAIEVSLQFINDKRSALGLAPLSIDAVLNDYALRHAQRMADSCQLSHQNLSNILGVKDARGKRLTAVAENVAYHSSRLDGALQNLWMSDGHRANMLGSYNRIGIAVVGATNPDCSGFVYTAQVFGRS